MASVPASPASRMVGLSTMPPWAKRGRVTCGSSAIPSQSTPMKDAAFSTIPLNPPMNLLIAPMTPLIIFSTKPKSPLKMPFTKSLTAWKAFWIGVATLSWNQAPAACQTETMLVHRVEKNPPILSTMGAKKLTSGWITFIWNHPLTVCQTN